MENASKALIIAGAILLSIAIIGIGMYIYNQAEVTIKSAGSGLSTQQITTFNSEYTAYEGVQSGTTVRTLLDKIRTYNIEQGTDTMEMIGVFENTATAANSTNRGVVTATEVNNIKTRVRPGSRYFVDFGYDETTGRVISIGLRGAGLTVTTWPTI